MLHIRSNAWLEADYRNEFFRKIHISLWIIDAFSAQFGHQS